MAKNNVSLGSKLGISSNILDVVKAELINTIYPVGAIYISYNSTNPATLFGGTWTQIKDAFLLSAGNTYSAGSTGGTAKHTHQYGVGYRPYYGALTGKDEGAIWLAGYDANNNISYKSTYTWAGPSNNDRRNSSLGTGTTTGGGNVTAFANVQYTSNLPPYLTVYMWRRTA